MEQELKEIRYQSRTYKRLETLMNRVNEASIKEEHRRQSGKKARVMIYQYEELTKLKVFFSLEDEVYIPKIELGAGGGVPGYPDRVKGYIYKDTDGLLLKYLRSNDTEILLRLGEDGLQGSSAPLVDIDLYNDSMFTEYGDGTIYEWTFTKDERE